MKKFFIISLSLILISQCLAAQDKNVPRRIYLWDVTLSMKGYNGKPDIYDDVVKYLERSINEIQDESTEVYILPFQEDVLDTWSANCSVEGKKSLIEKVKGYKNDKVTNTNITRPIQYVKEHIISDAKRPSTFFWILTDGAQSNNFGGIKALSEELCRWPGFAVEHKAHLVYVMLTNEAENEARSIIPEDNKGTITPVGPNESLWDQISIKCKEQVSVNLKDDKTISVPISNESSIAIPSGIKVQYVSQQDSLVNQIIGQSEIIDGVITFAADFGAPYDSLKATLPEEYLVPLQFQIINSEEVKQSKKLNVVFSQSTTVVRILNKPEKTLKISLKKK